MEITYHYPKVTTHSPILPEANLEDIRYKIT